MSVHIATSIEVGRAVRRGLRVTAGYVPDNWMVGPCASGPEEHAQARCDYWEFRGRDRSRWLGAFREMMEAIDSSERLVVWTSRLWSDTAAFWAICAWRLLRRPAAPDIDRVLLGGEAEVEGAAGMGGGSIHVTPAEARRGLEQVRPLSATRVREMALFWRKLAGKSPILAGKGDRAAPGRKELSELGDYQAGFLPRQGASGLLLSRFDELLFSCLGEKGSTPVEVFVSRTAAGEELRRWLCATGDVFLAARLAQWAHHGGPDAALTSEPHQPENILKAARYTLSKTGQAIQRRGLTGIGQGAPLPLWGVTAYEPSAPWVVVSDGEGGQHVRRLDRKG